MTTYICSGSTEEFSFTLPESWHSFDTFYDSRAGVSPLAQLCRVVNTLETALLREPSEFFTVGSFPPDTAFAGYSYESNPQTNPIKVTSWALYQCATYTLRCLRNNYTASSLYRGPCSTDGVVRYVDNIDLFNEYYLLLNTSSALSKENWWPYLLLVRELLEKITLEEQAYVEPYKTVGYIRNQLKYIRYERQFSYGYNDPAALFPWTGGRTQIRFGNGTSWANYNLWPDRQKSPFGVDHEETAENIANGLYIYGPNSLGAAFSIPWAGNKPLIATSSDGAYYYTFDNLGTVVGWRTYQSFKTTVRFYKKAYRNNNAGLVTVEDIETLFDELEGETVNWIASDGSVGSVGTPTFTTSPATSGSFTWGPGEHYKDIDFEFNLINPNPNGVNTSITYCWVRFTSNSIYDGDTYYIGQDCDDVLHVCFDEV